MTERPKISVREHQRRIWQRAMSVRGFCESVGIGRTRFYQEVKTGRLRVRKVGRRTIVTSDDAEDWLNRLPVLQEPFNETVS